MLCLSRGRADLESLIAKVNLTARTLALAPAQPWLVHGPFADKPPALRVLGVLGPIVEMTSESEYFSWLSNHATR
jgi:hypothetical protein